jgi:hypothetical protein
MSLSKEDAIEIWFLAAPQVAKLHKNEKIRLVDIWYCA